MKAVGCAIAMSLMAGLAVNAVDTPALRLLEVGQWHGDQVVGDKRAPWFGPAPSPNGFQWRKYSPRFSMVEDILVDEPGQKTGVAVEVAGPRPVFLLQGATHITKARIKTAFHEAEGLFLYDNPVRSLMLGVQQYTLRLTYVRESTSALLQDSFLLLEQGDLKQVLYTWPDGFHDGACYLIWAGDLDGDGRLDLYMYLSDHYNVTEHTLFLSSAAGPNRLVGRAAMWRTLGC